MVSHLNKRKFL